MSRAGTRVRVATIVPCCDAAIHCALAANRRVYDRTTLESGVHGLWLNHAGLHRIPWYNAESGSGSDFGSTMRV
jgi:hypothetical protein